MSRIKLLQSQVLWDSKKGCHVFWKWWLHELLCWKNGSWFFFDWIRFLTKLFSQRQTTSTVTWHGTGMLTIQLMVVKFHLAAVVAVITAVMAYREVIKHACSFILMYQSKVFAVRNYYKWSFTALNLINCREITAMKSDQYKLCLKQLKYQSFSCSA